MLFKQSVWRDSNAVDVCLFGRQPSAVSNADARIRDPTLDSLTDSSSFTFAWQSPARLLKMLLSFCSLSRSRCSTALAAFVGKAAAAMNCVPCR